MNNQMIPTEQRKITFRDYYFALDSQSPRSKVRDLICNTLNIAESSLWDKLRNNRFTAAEKIVIADILSEPIETLFPEAD